MLHRVIRSPLRKKFVKAVRTQGIKWADATKRIPLPDKSVEALYTCHMMEHLDQEEVRLFLKEAHRVLKPSGIVRVVVPDLRILIDGYLESGNADDLIAGTFLAVPKPKTLSQKLLHLLNGHRNHHWIYDAASMSALLESCGFSNTQILKPGATTIPDPGELNLFDWEGESLYIEAIS